MTIATLDYQAIRQAVLQLPQPQRLQLIKEAILTLTMDEPAPLPTTDADETLAQLQRAFAKAGSWTDQARQDARYEYLVEKHGQ
jgi:hypothetical protein